MMRRIARKPLLLAACALLLLLLYLLYNCVLVSNSSIFLRRLDFVVPKDPNLKYIYQRTSPDHSPFSYMKRGQRVFIEHKCTYQNCYVTSNKGLLGDVRLFDAVLFHAPELGSVWLKPARSVIQKFVFVSQESSHYYPVCSTRWDEYFNWTWTYRLDSDLVYPYMTVRDEVGRIVAPARYVSWLPHYHMAPVPDVLRDALRHKRLVAAWLVSNCKSLSKRQNFVQQLQQELDRFKLHVDVWGYCGNAANSTEDFHKQVERDYYFYLAFENSFSDDYVTEKVLHATKHLAVPIVFGGADYTRFLPPHSYIDARALGAAATARIMRDLIANPSQYAEYHRWRSHYSYHDPDESAETNPNCRLCELMNSEQFRIRTVYQNFRSWWNGSAPNTCLF